MRPGHDDVGGLFVALVSNTAPWTYLGEQEIQPTPEASFDAGLDLAAAGAARPFFASEVHS